MDQMVHRKGIAGGYISRAYTVHPHFPCLMPELMPPTPDLLLDGEPVPCYTNALYDLARHNYRYVVWHKPRPGDPYSQDPAEVEATSAYLLGLLAGQEPLVDDAWLTVYEVPKVVEAAKLAPAVGFAANWYSSEDGARRWARSPATLSVSSPIPQEAVLEILPDLIGEPGQPGSDRGVLTVELDGTLVTSVVIQRNERSAVGLQLPAGFHTLTLQLAAGNFRPSDRGGADSRWLSFAIQSINLQLGAESGQESLAATLERPPLAR
jgi:hypothetical protein